MKPYLKRSHHAWYVNLGKPVRLATEAEGEQIAWERFYALYRPTKIKDFVERFLDSRTTPATREFYERRLRRFAAEVGVVQAGDLRPYHFTDWLKRSGGNFNAARAVKACFNYAAAQGYIAASPFKGVKIGPAPKRGDETYVSDAEIERFAAKADEDFREALTVFRETGCRPQEFRRVEKRHLFDDTWRFSAAESKGGRPRTVYLTPAVAAICQRLALKYPEGPLFRRRNGKPWTAKSLDRKFAAISKRSGICICPYALRHKFCTDAIVRGVDLMTLATLLGHVNLRMLNHIYQHLNRRGDHLREAIQRATA